MRKIVELENSIFNSEKQISLPNCFSAIPQLFFKQRVTKSIRTYEYPIVHVV